jgi:hypothetical protein
MATMMNAKWGRQSVESTLHLGRRSCGVPKTDSENPLDRAHPDQTGYFAGSRCPALPTTGGLANRGASWSASLRPGCGKFETAGRMDRVCPQTSPYVLGIDLNRSESGCRPKPNGRYGIFCRALRSTGLCAGGFRHFTPLLGFSGDEGGELRGVERHRYCAEIGERASAPYQADRPRHARDIRGRIGLALDCRSGPGPRTTRCRARSSF